MCHHIGSQRCHSPFPLFPLFPSSSPPRSLNLPLVLTLYTDATEERVQEVKRAFEAKGYSCWEAKIGGPGVMFHIDESAKL